MQVDIEFDDGGVREDDADGSERRIEDGRVVGTEPGDDDADRSGSDDD